MQYIKTTENRNGHATWCNSVPTNASIAYRPGGKATIMEGTMKKLDIARQHCCNWHRGACVFDKPCEPEKCSYWPVVEATAARASGTTTKGAKR